MLGIKINRHAPGEAGAADAQILQAGLEEVVDHLIGAAGGLDEIRMVLDVIDQPVLILAHTEEIAFFGYKLGGTAAVGAHFYAVLFHQLAGGPESFAGGAVLAFVRCLIDIALLVELAEDLLHNLLVTLVGGTDEVIVFDVHQLPQFLGIGNDFVHISLGGYALFGSLALDLLAMLVGAGQEIGVITRQLLEAGHGVGRNGGVGVADVHIAGGIVDGCGNVIFLFLHWSHPSLEFV